MKQIIIAACASIAAGCISTEPKVEPTSQWEGHYYSFDEVKQKIDGQTLDEDQSIWLLSNTTLKRLLKDIEGK